MPALAFLVAAALHSLSWRSLHNQTGDAWGAEHGQAFLDVLSMLPAVERRAGCTLIDIGAHHGTVAIMALEAGCIVYAFEVQARSLRVLRRNLERFGDRARIFTHEPADCVVPTTVMPGLW